MKKLMITMLAASAVSAAAWAENEAGSTFSLENFNSKDAGAFSIAAPWEYSADSVGAGELTITTGGATDDGKFLGLNTASKKLSLAPNADGSEYAVASEVYFDSYVKFDAASDTIPEVGTNDKLALFVLDNTDYVAEGTTPSTALYVLGGFWNGSAIEKRLYRLDTDVSTLTDFKRVSIKMYKNVLKSGSVPGFVVKVGTGTDIAQVNGAFPIAADGSVNFADNSAFTATYLGAEIDSAVAATRYSATSHQLILGLQETVGTTTLSAVDFMGKGGIDDLAFGTTDVGFGNDASVYDVTLPAGVASVTCDGKTITDNTITITPGETLTFTFTLKPGYFYVDADGKIVTTLSVTVENAQADGKLSDVLTSNNIIEVVATVDGVAYELDDFLTDAANEIISGDIELKADINLGSTQLVLASDSTLNLNGCDLTSTAEDQGAIYVATKLAISGDGVITAAKVFDTSEGAVITINAGTFDGAVTGASIPQASTAKFKADVNTLEALVAMIADKVDTKNYTFALVDGYYTGITSTNKPVVSTITFMLGGASWAQDYAYPTSYTEGTGVELPAAEKLVYEGFEFGGWYDNDNFEGSAVTAIGTGATGNKTFYAKWTEVQEDVPVAPGVSTEVEAADQTAADAIADKVVVTVPADVKTGLASVPGGEDAYTKLFKGKATQTAPGKYVITLELKEEVVTEVQGAVDAAVTAVANALTDTEATSVTVATKPGLFYGLVKQTSLNGMGTAKPASDAWTMGTGAPLTFTLDKTGNCGFFKMVCSPTK